MTIPTLAFGPLMVGAAATFRLRPPGQPGDVTLMETRPAYGLYVIPDAASIAWSVQPEATIVAQPDGSVSFSAAAAGVYVLTATVVSGSNSQTFRISVSVTDPAFNLAITRTA